LDRELRGSGLDGLLEPSRFGVGIAGEFGHLGLLGWKQDGSLGIEPVQLPIQSIQFFQQERLEIDLAPTDRVS
jgi:hypothetical protein